MKHSEKYSPSVTPTSRDGRHIWPVVNHVYRQIEPAAFNTRAVQPRAAARNNNDLVDECKDFADAFGEDCAYVGWAWTMNVTAAQNWTSEFLNNLKGGKTVQQAHAKFIAENFQASQDVKLMKIYGSINNVIDKNVEESNQ